MEYMEDERFQNQIKAMTTVGDYHRFYISSDKDYSTSLQELEAIQLPFLLVADQKEIAKCIALLEIVKRKRDEIKVQYNGVLKWKTPFHPISGKKSEDEVKGERLYDVPVFLGVLSNTELELDSAVWTKQAV